MVLTLAAPDAEENYKGVDFKRDGRIFKKKMGEIFFLIKKSL